MTETRELSILVILMGSLGDVVRGLAILPQLKQQMACRITWLVEPKCRGIVELDPLIDEVIVFERGRGLRGVAKLRKQLAERRFDVTLDMQRHLKSGFFSFLSGSPRRIGFHRANAKELNWLFNNEHLAPEPESTPKLLHYLKFIERLGAVTKPSAACGFGSLPIPAEVGGFELSGFPYVVVVTATSWESKEWAPEGYQRLVSELASRGLRVVLVGDKSRSELSDSIKAASGSGRVHNLCGATTLAELVGLIRRAVACVGPDSGPGHIAAAVGTPYVSLFGPTPPERVAPFGHEALVVRSSIGCSPCKRRRCPGLDRLCMRLISVDSVLERLIGCLPAGTLRG